MKGENLHILWTNGDPITSDLMVLMYTRNAKLRNWWKEITLVIWGAPAKLVAEDQWIQEKVKLIQEAGVHVTACSSCAGQLGVIEILEDLGIEVIPWGEKLTELIKNNESLITI